MGFALWFVAGECHLVSHFGPVKRSEDPQSHIVFFSSIINTDTDGIIEQPRTICTYLHRNTVHLFILYSTSEFPRLSDADAERFIHEHAAATRSWFKRALDKKIGWELQWKVWWKFDTKKKLSVYKYRMVTEATKFIWANLLETFCTLDTNWWRHRPRRREGCRSRLVAFLVISRGDPHSNASECMTLLFHKAAILFSFRAFGGICTCSIWEFLLHCNVGRPCVA